MNFLCGFMTGEAEGYILLLEVLYLLLMMIRSPLETAWTEKKIVIASSVHVYSTDYLLITTEIGTLQFWSDFSFHLEDFRYSFASSKHFLVWISTQFKDSQNYQIAEARSCLWRSCSPNPLIKGRSTTPSCSGPCPVGSWVPVRMIFAFPVDELG